MYQRKHNQRRQQNVNRVNRIPYQRYQRRVRPINNQQDTLNRIVNLPQQFINDPQVDQFFNGSPFY